MKQIKEQPEEFAVEREDAVLFGRKRGAGPGLLLIHGVACDSDYFEEAAKLLAKKFTVIPYDRRGCSRSRVNEAAMENTAGGNPFTLRIQAEDAAAVIRASGQQKVFVTGSSAGGVVASRLAALYPELVSGLFLHEPAFRGAEAVAAGMDTLVKKLREARDTGRMIRALWAFIESMGGVDERAESKSLQKQARDLENLKVFVQYEMESFFEADLNLLREISVPLWIGAGEGSREGLFHRTAAEIAGKLKLPLIFVPGYHNFPSDLPREFAVTVSGVYDMTVGFDREQDELKL